MIDHTEEFSLEKKKSFTPMEMVYQNMKYLPWIIASLVISAILAVVYLRYTPDIFASKGKMIIKSDNSAGTGDEKFNRLLLLEPGPNLTNEIAIIRSTSFVERVVEKMNLQMEYKALGNVRATVYYKDSPIKLEVITRKDSSRSTFQITILNENEFKLNKSESKRFGDVIKTSNGLFRITYINNRPITDLQTREYEITCLPLDVAAERLIRQLQVKQSTEFGNIIELAFQSTSKDLATDFVNALMDEYGISTIEEKTSIARNTIRFIEDRLDSLQSELSDVEGSIQQFREKNQGADLATQSLQYSTLISEAQSKTDEFEVKKRILGWLRDYLKKEDNKDNTVPVNLGIDEPTLLSLVSSYNQLQIQKTVLLKSTTEKNPKVVELEESIKKLQSDIIESLNSIERSYDISIARIQGRYAEAQKNVVSIPGKARQLLNIERQQKIKEELYLLLLSKKEEVAIAASAVAPNSTILERATNRPVLVEPLPNNILMKFLLAGIVVPILVIVLITYFNDSIKSAMDIERLTNTPLLGEVVRSDDPNPVLVTTNGRSFITEQFRSIRNNIGFFATASKTPVLLITSSISGEGKTFISTNVAAAFAVAGKKTLLMEFDIRKPKIASNFGINSLKGISSILVANERPDATVISVNSIPNLYVLPCGAIPPNPSELLLLPDMEKLFDWARSNFDVIIVDSAPIGIVSDALTLSKHADASLYIVRQDYTLKKAIELIDKLYVQKRLPSMSIILNDVKMTKGRSYSYGYGYGYGVGKESTGYFEFETDKKPSFFKKLLNK